MGVQAPGGGAQRLRGARYWAGVLALGCLAGYISSVNTGPSAAPVVVVLREQRHNAANTAGDHHKTRTRPPGAAGMAVGMDYVKNHETGAALEAKQLQAQAEAQAEAQAPAQHDDPEDQTGGAAAAAERGGDDVVDGGSGNANAHAERAREGEQAQQRGDDSDVAGRDDGKDDGDAGSASADGEGENNGAGAAAAVPARTEGGGTPLHRPPAAGGGHPFAVVDMSPHVPPVGSFLYNYEHFARTHMRVDPETRDVGGVEYLRMHDVSCSGMPFVGHYTVDLAERPGAKPSAKPRGDGDGDGDDAVVIPPELRVTAEDDIPIIEALVMEACNSNPICQGVVCGGVLPVQHRTSDRMCWVFMPTCTLENNTNPNEPVNPQARGKRGRGRMRPAYPAILYLNPARQWRAKGLLQIAQGHVGDVPGVLDADIPPAAYEHLRPEVALTRETARAALPGGFDTLFPTLRDLELSPGAKRAWGPSGWGFNPATLIDPRADTKWRRPIKDWPAMWEGRAIDPLPDTALDDGGGGGRMVLVTNITRRILRKHVIVDPYHKLILFTIPKVASTELLKMYDRLVGYPSYGRGHFWAEAHSPEKSSKERVELYHFTAMEATLLLNSKAYKKILFLRDPAERVLSAFLDRVVGPDITEKYREQVIGESLGRPPKDITFPEFINILHKARFLKKTMSTGPFANRHWMSQMLVGGMYRYLPRMDFIGWANSAHIKEAFTKYGLWDEFGEKWMGQDEAFFQRKQGAKVHTTDADSKIKKYFTPRLMQMTREIYRIDYYFIEEEIKLLKDGPPVSGYHVPMHEDRCTPPMPHVENRVVCIPGGVL